MLDVPDDERLTGRTGGPNRGLLMTHRVLVDTAVSGQEVVDRAWQLGEISDLRHAVRLAPVDHSAVVLRASRDHQVAEEHVKMRVAAPCSGSRTG